MDKKGKYTELWSLCDFRESFISMFRDSQDRLNHLLISLNKIEKFLHKPRFFDFHDVRFFHRHDYKPTYIEECTINGDHITFVIKSTDRSENGEYKENLRNYFLTIYQPEIQDLRNTGSAEWELISEDTSRENRKIKVTKNEHDDNFFIVLAQ